MAMGQSFMPQNVGMASGLILGLAMRIGGIKTTALGWAAEQWGVLFTLQIFFILPMFAFTSFLLLPYLPQNQDKTPKS
jgi:FSR family fosmidomycin resistance protein-like MFS transporter